MARPATSGTSRFTCRDQLYNGRARRTVTCNPAPMGRVLAGPANRLCNRQLVPPLHQGEAFVGGRLSASSELRRPVSDGFTDRISKPNRIDNRE